ncbi:MULTISPECIES: DUF3179 domain-containing protein [unclassified Roseovarius]|uniref:DUF3179 domain-containing protein n=1 Tax=unclassified Roseovarius TaxID=2614913 RepID=UPI00273E84C5|nr:MULTISPECIES: DUF3179 domain-containing protein [unclassified Roseovarius]
MPLSRRRFIASTAAIGALPAPLLAQSSQTEFDLLHDTITGPPDRAFAALTAIRDRGKPDLAAGLIMAMRFSNLPRHYFAETLTKITGTDAGDSWFDWMLWQEANPQVVPHQASLIALKREVYLQIDPNFDVFLKKRHLRRDRMKIRLEEITWGGVRKDGIPSLDNPRLITAGEASYMRDSDLVFGVSINGDTRAYPLRIMGWHEMFNEVIGGVPVALAYCTLCGSGILFETKVQGRSRPLVFGSSGFLYRSNKLMFDRATHSLWNQFTGKPVSGKLVNSGIELQQRPVVITTWQNWRSDNPDTRILSLQTGHRRNYGSGVVYQEYFASNDLMFPTNVDQRQHRQKDYVFGIREFGGAKAWPLKAFRNRRVINDAMQGRPLVLIGDAKSRSVRAYERGNLTFKSAKDGLLSSDGRRWTIGEEVLRAANGETLPRVAGHIAYWFAWNGYLGSESALYKG